MRVVAMLSAIIILANVSGVLALQIEAQSMGRSASEMDEFGNYASAWVRASNGGFDIEPVVLKQIDSYGNPSVGAYNFGNAWTTDGYVEVGTSAYDSEGSSVSSMANVNGIGSISVNEYAISGFGQLYTNQWADASLGGYGSIGASSNFWGLDGYSNVNANVEGSGSLTGVMGAVKYDSYTGAAVQDVSLTNNGYGSASVYANSGDFYSGSASVNAYVFNGAITSRLTAEDYAERFSRSYGEISETGDYGSISLDSYAAGSGAGSNKFAEFWYGFAYSGVEAGTDSWSAYTNWV